MLSSALSSGAVAEFEAKVCQGAPQYDGKFACDCPSAQSTSVLVIGNTATRGLEFGGGLLTDPWPYVQRVESRLGQDACRRGITSINQSTIGGMIEHKAYPITVHVLVYDETDGS